MKNKNRLSQIKKDYIKIPNKADKIGMSPNAMRVLVAMINCGEDFNPSLAYLSRRTGLSRSTLTRVYKQLILHGVIRLLKRGRGNRTSEYEFMPMKMWRSVKMKNTISVERNKIMQRSKRLTTGEALMRKRLNCPKGKLINYIIPIIHPIVCGLNVPWNIQYLTKEESILKGASFDGSSENNTWRN